MSAAMRLLRLLPPERAHALTLRGLRFAPPQWTEGRSDDARLAVRAMGLAFTNPVGTAAGFDKAARAPAALLRMGFGFHEVGGVTPRPQRGNPRPRVFRLAQDRAVINRLGFNNPGAGAVRRRLEALAGRRGPVGVNVGANKDSADMAADFAAVVRALAPVVDYASLNVSSPNTPGLRDLQRADALRRLVEGALEARDAAGRRLPILIKIAPDLDEDGFGDIVDLVRDVGVDGLVLTNTTLARPDLVTSTSEGGGLSGPPLFRRATRLLAQARVALGSGPTLIGVGGVDSPGTALAKIEAGADLVQLYTGLIYEGPNLLGRIKRGLLDAVAQAGAPDISALVGRRASDWAEGRL